MSRTTRRPNPYNAQKWTSRAISTSAVQRIGSCADALDRKGHSGAPNLGAHQGSDRRPHRSAHLGGAARPGSVFHRSRPPACCGDSAQVDDRTRAPVPPPASIRSTTADGRRPGDEGRRWRPAHRPPTEIPQSIHERQRHHRKRPSVAFAESLVVAGSRSWTHRSTCSSHPTFTAPHQDNEIGRGRRAPPTSMPPFWSTPAKRLVPDGKRRRRRLLDGRWVPHGASPMTSAD